MPTTATFTLKCERCGMEFKRRLRIGAAKPRTCPECPAVQPSPIRSASYDLALRVVEYRLAIEMATALLASDRPTLALAVLRDVEAPARTPMECRRGCGFAADTPKGRQHHEGRCAG